MPRSCVSVQSQPSILRSPRKEHEQRLHFTESFICLHISPALAAEVAMDWSKPWDYDKEDDWRVYEEKDPDSLFPGDETSTTVTLSTTCMVFLPKHCVNIDCTLPFFLFLQYG